MGWKPEESCLLSSSSEEELLLLSDSSSGASLWGAFCSWLRVGLPDRRVAILPCRRKAASNHGKARSVRLCNRGRCMGTRTFSLDWVDGVLVPLCW